MSFLKKICVDFKYKIYILNKTKKTKKMAEKTITIEEMKEELGINFHLVKIIWSEICIKSFCIVPEKVLHPKEVPLDECTEAEKVLLTCIAFLDDNQEEKQLLSKALLSSIYRNHKIQMGTKVAVRKLFFIVSE